MLKNLFIVLLTGLFLASCAVEPTSITPDGSRQGAASTLIPTRTVGTGHGDLTIDGKALGILPGEVVAIQPGTYQSLTVSNLNGIAFRPIRLVANDLVEVVGDGVSLQNVSYLTIDGGPLTKNFSLHDISYRGITISGTTPHALTLQGIRVKNIGDYTIYYNNATPYNGTDNTAFTDFKLLYCDFENIGTIEMRGDLYKSGGLINYGLLKNPEIAFNLFRNSPTAGSLLYMGNAENVNIHHNWINNINTQNNNHNGVFFIKGNGSVHHNKCTNHQGNFVRFWPFSQGGVPKEVLIHDNIVWNSRKYSGFELQSFAENMIGGVSTYCNAKVYNNTVGRMNTTRPTVFVGVVVDVYNLYGGDLQIFNNLSFEQVKTSATDNGIWSQQNVTKPSYYSNNRNFTTSEDAGLADRNYFRLLPGSPAKGTGIYRVYETDDFYGAQRTTTPSVGAVE